MCRDGKVHGFVVSSDMQSKAGLLVENERDSLLYGILELSLNGLYFLLGYYYLYYFLGS